MGGIRSYISFEPAPWSKEMAVVLLLGRMHMSYPQFSSATVISKNSRIDFIILLEVL